MATKVIELDMKTLIRATRATQPMNHHANHEGPRRVDLTAEEFAEGARELSWRHPEARGR